MTVRVDLSLHEHSALKYMKLSADAQIFLQISAAFGETSNPLRMMLGIIFELPAGHRSARVMPQFGA